MRWIVPTIFALVLLSFGAPALAQDSGASPQAESPQQRKAEFDAAAAAAQAAQVAGPADVKLADKGMLRLPAGKSWVPRAEADRYLRAAGHRSNPELIGIVSGGTSQHGWLAIVTFTGGGYVKDDDAGSLDPNKILAELREGAEEDNKDRVARGFQPLILDDWLQPPKYDAANKWLVWALPVHTSENADNPTINYNTRALGREGFFSLNLLTDKPHFDVDKLEAGGLLKAIQFSPGHRYVDFNPSTDKVAAYGLAALIGVVALKKLGILAIASAFLLKFAKLGIVLVIGAFAAAKRFLFGGKRSGPNT